MKPKDAEKTFAIALACLTLSSCTYQIAVQDGFYKEPASAGDSQTHTKVGIYVPEVVRTSRFHLVENCSGIKTEAMVSSFPAFELALSSALKPLFDLRSVEDPQQTKDLDLLLAVGADFPNPVTLIFSDPRTQAELRWFSHDGPGITFNAGSFSGEIRSAVESSLREAIKALSAQVANDERLLHYAANEAQVQALSDKAAVAEKAGRLDEAFKDYKQALVAAWPGSASDETCRRGMIRLAGQLPPPTLPEEARRHMERGKILVKQARGSGDFKIAAAEMEQAVDAAPWWADGYYNLGLVESSAGIYGDAAKNLKLYLASNPRGGDANAVQKKIYELELRSERKIGRSERVDSADREGARTDSSAERGRFMESVRTIVPRPDLSDTMIKQLYEAIRNGKDAVWLIGSGLTKDGRWYRLRWDSGQFTQEIVSEEEVRSGGYNAAGAGSWTFTN